MAVDLMRRSFRAQKDHAKKLGAKVLAFVGPKEMEAEKVTLYREDGVRLEVSLQELSKVKELL